MNRLVLLDIPTPSVLVSVNQNSLTVVTVTLTVTDTRCAAMYFVEVTQDGSSDPPIIMSSSSPSVSVTDLDLCRNSYSIVGFVQAPSGQRGARSSSQPIPVDLSGTHANQHNNYIEHKYLYFSVARR